MSGRFFSSRSSSHRRRSLRVENLEERRVLDGASLLPAVPAGEEFVWAAATAPIVADSDVVLLTENLFYKLTPQQVPLLSLDQVAAMENQVYFYNWTQDARDALTVEQVGVLNVAELSISLLSKTQRQWLTSTQLRTLDAYKELQFLPTSKVPYLTASQIKLIPNTFAFDQWTPEARGVLTKTQVEALNAAEVSISLLTAAQREWLTNAQVGSLHEYKELQFLPASKIPALTASQIALIPNTFAFDQWSPEARQALLREHVEALNVAQISIGLLTPVQREWLTTSQVRSLDDYADFRFLSATKVPSLTPAQIALVPDTFAFDQWSAASRAALTETQVRALDVKEVTIGDLLPSQRLWLTVAQIERLLPSAWQYLDPSQIAAIRPGDIALINSDFVFSSDGGWSDAQRAALTRVQIEAIKVSREGRVRINWLTDQQIGWLTQSQIASVATNDIKLLHEDQIPFVTPEQFSTMTTLSEFVNFSDKAKENLTRAQLMALPVDVLSQYMLVEPNLVPSAMAMGMHHMPLADAPMPGTMGYFAYYITQLADATHVAIADGDWSDPAIWSSNTVPGADAKVYIQAGRTVRFNTQMAAVLKTVRIDGTLTFATDRNTTMRVDTIVVGIPGKLHIGTEAAPIGDKFVARLTFPDGGPIDTVWDPGLASRGLISLGEVRMYGKETTPFVELAVDPMRGDQELKLASLPLGWRVGDELVIAGVDPIVAEFGSERVRIAEISGTSIRLDRALELNHDAPDGFGFSVHVANLSRNIQFLAEDPTVAQQRPHIAFVQNPNVVVENVLVDGFGRTDKTKPATDPVVVDNVLQSGGENARARYALHFHHTGVDPDVAPGVLRGNVVINSPGWGYVNHQSHVVMEDNVAFDVVGAAFVGEDGNEIGAMRNNLAINAFGTAFTGVSSGPLARKEIHDFGYNGHGFWMQGPGIELEGNVVSGSASSAYAYFTASTMAMFDAENLDNPALAQGNMKIPVQAAPLKRFSGNLSYAVHQGLEIWFSQLGMPGAESVIDNYTTWNTRRAVQLFYSDHITIRDSTLLGRLELLANEELASPFGVSVNSPVQNITLDNIRVEGFVDGIIAPVRRTTTIIGGRLRNVRNLTIVKGHDTLRTVDVVEPIEFVPLAASEINGRETYNIGLTQDLKIHSDFNRKLESLFAEDTLRVKLTNGLAVRLYFSEQGGNVTPFTDAQMHSPIDLTDYVGLTNAQLQARLGMSFNGDILPAGSTSVGGVDAMVVVETQGPVANFDGDRDIDGRDFLLWQRGYGASSSSAVVNGDADRDHDVDSADLSHWENGFGVIDLLPAPTGVVVGETPVPIVEQQETPATGRRPNVGRRDNLDASDAAFASFSASTAARLFGIEA
ncbi:MAG: G8 domain-containing protein [Planctomycetales bacterium]|nr:G8 domain-containing protein [Planctomycetales bacterium]